MLDQFNIGDELRIQINLRVREWNGPQGIKYFNTLEARKIEKFSGGTTQANTSSNQTTNQNTTKQGSSSAPVFTGNVDDNDDLPF
jgi:hypothetical protein